MFKLTAYFLLAWLAMAVMSGVLAGGGGVIVTYLTQAETSVAVTLHVADTTGLLTEDTVQVGGEYVHYTGLTTTPHTLTGCTRGYDGTEAKAHANGAHVHTLESGALNSALGFSVPRLADDMGWIAFIAIPVSFVTTTIPRAIAYNYNFLQGDLWFFAMIFYVLGLAWVFTLAWSVIGARRV